MKNSGLKLVIGLSSFSAVILIIGILLTSISKAQNTSVSEWQPLSELVSAAKLAQIVTDNTAPSADRAAIASSAIGILKDDLLVVDFKTDGLCGRAGCAVAGYQASSGEQILFTYALRPAADRPIVELIDKADADFPCLLIAPSIGNTSQGLTEDALCYRSGQWTTEAP